MILNDVGCDVYCGFLLQFSRHEGMVHHEEEVKTTMGCVCV